MMRNFVFLVLCCVVALTWSITLASAGETVESFSMRNGSAFNVLVINPGNTTNAVVLFAGGDGVVNIADNGQIGEKKTNFLVRSRNRFADNGLVTAVIDAPEDLRDGRGLKDGFRLTKEHAEDVGAVIARLRADGMNKIWLVGTSRGSISAASAAAHLGPAPKGPDGIVLTSSVVVSGNDPDTVLDVDLAIVTSPVLIVHHEEDVCVVSNFSDIGPMKDGLSNVAEIETMTITGGKAGKAKNICKGKSHHGFLKIEGRIVTDIANWIKAR